MVVAPAVAVLLLLPLLLSLPLLVVPAPFDKPGWAERASSGFASDSMETTGAGTLAGRTFVRENVARLTRRSPVDSRGNDRRPKQQEHPPQDRTTANSTAETP